MALQLIDIKQKSLRNQTMRRVLTAVTCFALSLSGLTFSPANATGTYDGTSGTVDCTTNGTPTGSFTITDNIVTTSNDCTGDVVIPQDVLTVGQGAFSGAGITSVSFPMGDASSVTSIERNAFSNTLLTSITIPTKALVYRGPLVVANIGDNAFSGISTLTHVYLLGNEPATVGVTPFAGAPITAKAIVKTPTGYGASTTPRTWNGLAVETYVEGLPYDPATRYGIVNCFYPGDDDPSGHFTIEDNVVTGDSDCEGNAHIPKEVTKIGPESFGGFSAGDSDVESVTFEAGSQLIEIEAGAFQNADELQSISLPASLRMINFSAFDRTISLENISFEGGSKLEAILEGAFSSSMLRSIVFPASLKTIDSGAFRNTTLLSSVTFESGSQLEIIGEEAFRNSALTSIVIPASVQGISHDSFKNASNLSMVYFQGNAPAAADFGTDVFLGVDSNARVCFTRNATGFTPVVNNIWNGLEISNCAITYNANGATGGSVPIDPKSMYVANENATILANTGGLERTGYRFSGWSNVPEGSSEYSYTASGSETLQMGQAGVTLYAQWALANYTITYDGNSFTSGSAPAVTTGSGAVNLQANTGTLARNGYKFVGWNTLADGKGTDFAESSTYGLNSDVTLYAKWLPTATEKSLNLTVSFGKKSSKLSAKEKKKILSSIMGIGSKVTSGVVVGYVQRDGNRSNDNELSAARAKVIASFLADNGVPVRLLSSGKGALNTKKSSRKAIVSLKYVE